MLFAAQVTADLVCRNLNYFGYGVTMAQLVCISKKWADQRICSFRGVKCLEMYLKLFGLKSLLKKSVIDKARSIFEHLTF